jgi:hypothetical protein
MQLAVDYTALRNAYWQNTRLYRLDYEPNSLGLGSCMQPLRAHKPNGVASREGSQHHNDRDTGSRHLHHFPGGRNKRREFGLDSSIEMCACVIHATFFVVVPMMVQLCFTDARLPSGVGARHRCGLTSTTRRDVRFGGSPQTPHLAHLPGTLLRNSRRKRRRARAPRCSCQHKRYDCP